MPTILTGLRVNSEFTLGNFLGALLPMVRLANQYNTTHHINIFIPDLHSIISEVDGDLQANILRSMKVYFAAGLDVTSPAAQQHVHLYRQSHVPAHSELTWMLDCLATMGELGRMTQYKDKGEGKNSANVGIFNYPVLMAADILLYSATYIPVGEDQFQHLELTRDLALRANHHFKQELFVVPATTAEQVRFMGVENGLRIRDLQDPTKKMSKSSRSANSKIMLSDTPEQARKKIMSATTDSFGKIQFDMFNQPGISNLLQIEALTTNTPLQDVISTWAGETHYGDLKQRVATSVSTYLADFQSRLNQVSNQQILDYLTAGETYANEVANAKLRQVQEAFHLR